MLIIILLSYLAVWRLTHVVQEESGPFAIFSRLQAWYWTEPHCVGGLKDGLRCFNCTSVWLSLPFAFVANQLDSYHQWWLFFVYWLGIAGGVIVLEKILNK